MGNYRFKLSDMVPNAWFYKLKDLSRARKSQNRVHHPRNNQKPFESQSNSMPKNDTLLPCRASYYFSSRAEAEMPQASPLHPRASDNLFPQESPRKSKKSSRRKPADAIRSFKLSAPTASELPALKLELPPIMTKPAKRETGEAEAEERQQRRRSPTGIHRLRMRAGSPRKVQVGRKSVSKQGKKLSRTFAVVKSSTDPQKDFRDSMVEMISENDIRSSKDLEELLACYLLLNESEYHDVIVKVFEQIWFDLTDIRS